MGYNIGIPVHFISCEQRSDRMKNRKALSAVIAAVMCLAAVAPVYAEDVDGQAAAASAEETVETAEVPAADAAAEVDAEETEEPSAETTAGEDAPEDVPEDDADAASETVDTSTAAEESPSDAKAPEEDVPEEALPADIAEDTAAAAEETEVPAEDTAEDTSLTKEEIFARASEISQRISADGSDADFPCTELTAEEIDIICKAVDLEKQEAPADDLGTDSAVYLSASNCEHGYYYNYLTTAQKKMYDAMGDACAAYLTSNQSTVDSGGWFTYIVVDPSMTDAQIQQAHMAFFYSNPQYFFLSSRSMFGYYGADRIAPLLSYGDCRDASTRKAQATSINNTVNNWVAQLNACTTPSEKTRKMAKLIADKVSYAPRVDSATSSYHQSVLSPLYYGDSVCTGYAMTVKLLCQKVGIDCIIVTHATNTSTAHAWNRIKLGNKWFEYDATWYDSLNYNSSWLLRSTSSFLAMDSQSMHEVETAASLPLYTNVTLPQCPADFKTGDDLVTDNRCGNSLTWSISGTTLTISGSGAMYDYSSSSPAPWNSNAATLTKIVMPSGMTRIGNYAFYGCKDVTSISIPSSVTSIGQWALSHCEKITSVTLPSNMTAIADRTFDSCYALKSVTIPAKVTTINSFAFSGCSSLPSLTLPANLTSLGKWAFNGCKALTTFTIPNKVTAINENTFNNCSSLKAVTIPASVTTFGSNAFAGCSALTHIHIPYGKTAANYSGKGALPTNTAYYYPLLSDGHCSDSSCPMGIGTTVQSEVVASGNCGANGSNVKWTLYKDGTLKLTGSGAVDDYHSKAPGWFNSYNTTVKKVVVENGITKIGRSTFYQHPNLTTLSLPNTLTTIDDNAFESCGLTSVTIPASVTYVGEHAFGYCRNIKYLTIYSKNTTFETGSKSSFIGCDYLQHVHIPYGSSVSDHYGTGTSLLLQLDRPDFYILSADGHCSDPNCPMGLYKGSSTSGVPTPTVVVKIAFGGRTVQFNCADPDAEIYYNFATSAINTKCAHVKAGSTIFLNKPLSGSAAALYFRAYKNGKWSNLNKNGVLNVKIAQPLIKPKGSAYPNQYFIYTQTKNSYIIYTLDGTVPSITEGTQQLKVKNGTIIWGTQGYINVPRWRTVKAIAIRSGLVTSDVMTFTNR